MGGGRGVYVRVCACVCVCAGVLCFGGGEGEERETGGRPFFLFCMGDEGREPASPEVRFSPTMAASLRVLGLQSQDGYLARPPESVRHAGGALTALTRLEYGRPKAVGEDQAALDLAAWGDTAAGYGLPGLRVLSVWSATGFTVDGEGGRVRPNRQEWVAGRAGQPAPPGAPRPSQGGAVGASNQRGQAGASQPWTPSSRPCLSVAPCTCTGRHLASTAGAVPYAPGRRPPGSSSCAASQPAGRRLGAAWPFTVARTRRSGL